MRWIGVCSSATGRWSLAGRAYRRRSSSSGIRLGRGRVAKHGLTANGRDSTAPTGGLADRSWHALRRPYGLTHSQRSLWPPIGARPPSLLDGSVALNASWRAVREQFREVQATRRDPDLRACEGTGASRCPPLPDAMRCRRAWRRLARRKRRLVEEAGGSCRLCGYDRYQGSAPVSSSRPRARRSSPDRCRASRAHAQFATEAAKCVLLCANCHAEVEVGFTELVRADASIAAPPGGFEPPDLINSPKHAAVTSRGIARLSTDRRTLRVLGRSPVSLIRGSSTSLAARSAPSVAGPPRDRVWRSANRGSPSIRLTTVRTAPGRVSRQGSISPAPAHGTRAAFSVMSPTAGQQSSGTPAPSARHDRAVAAVADDQVGRRHRLRVGEPVDHHRVRRRRRQRGRPGRGGWSSPAPAPARRRAPPAPPGPGGPPGSCAVLGATTTSGASPCGNSTSGCGSSNSSARSRARASGQRRGYSSCGNVATNTRSLADAAVEALQRRQPDRRPRLVQLAAALAAGPPSAPAAPARHRRPAHRRPRPAARRRRRTASPARARDRRGAPASTRGTPAISAASDGASVRTSLTTASGR